MVWVSTPVPPGLLRVADNEITGFRLTRPVTGAVMVTASCGRLTTKVELAVGAALPARSRASTVKVWLPWTRGGEGIKLRAAALEAGRGRLAEGGSPSSR